jgi:cytochrome c-type biogenesis protein CcmE
MLSKKRIQYIVLILAIVAALIALVLSGIYFYQRVRLFYSRPLVLIFNPINREHIPPEGITMINANARTKAGVQRVELWVDDAFVFAQ